jgi:hypothetical protein
MNLRGELRSTYSCYLGKDVWHALKLLAQASSSEQKKTTIDEAADKILRKFFTLKYPQLLTRQKSVEQMERELVKSISASSGQADSCNSSSP